MPERNIIVIGASAGGVEALRTLVGGLPKNFPASIFVVIHTSPQSPGRMAAVLDRAGPLRAQHAIDGEPIVSGRIYVAPPDHHLLIDPGVVRVTYGPKENRFRPAIDPLFRSAAQVYGRRVIGIVLTGWLNDGTSGLWTIKAGGGTAIVQDPNEAVAPSMPQSALKYVDIDHCLPLNEIASLLEILVSRPMEEEGETQVPEETNIEIRIAKEDKAIEAGIGKIGEPSLFTCPECRGVLLRLNVGDLPRFRCHTGHAFTAESLLAEITEGIEDSLWNAIRSMEEGIMLIGQIAVHVHEDQHEEAEALLRNAELMRRKADHVRQVVMPMAKT